VKCDEYNSTSDANECYHGYDLGFKKGCEGNHDHSSYFATDGEYPSCYTFYKSVHEWTPHIS